MQKKEKLLIIGATGAVGSASIQIAKYLDAHVTAVCSTKNISHAKALGADCVIDYTCEDYLNTSERYDLVMDTVGLLSFGKNQHSLEEGGRLLLLRAGLSEIMFAPFTKIMSKKELIAGTAPEKSEDLRLLAELAENGKYKPLISSTLSLQDIGRAHAIVDSNHKVGSVVILNDFS